MTNAPLPSARGLFPALAAGTVLAGWLAGVLAAGGPTAAAPTTEAPVTFSFAPPAGTAYIQHEIFVETARLGGIQQKMTLASEATVDISHEAGHIFIVTRIQRAAAARDGRSSDAAMVAAMSGAETVNLARSNGVLVQIDGMRRLYDRLLPTMAGEERAALAARLRENRIDDRARASWFETTEILSGQTLELGRDYFFDAAWPTDEGWIQHQTLLRLGPWERSTYGRFLRLQLAYVPDARAAVPGAVRLQPKVATPFSPDAPGKLAKGYAVTGNASRLVDPATLLVWRDQTLREVRNRVEVSEDLALTVSSAEGSDITLEPAPPPQAAKPEPAPN